MRDGEKGIGSDQSGATGCADLGLGGVAWVPNVGDRIRLKHGTIQGVVQAADCKVSVQWDDWGAGFLSETRISDIAPVDDGGDGVPVHTRGQVTDYSPPPNPLPTPGSGVGVSSEEIQAMRDVVAAARNLPRQTPGPGGCSTPHQFTIDAAYVWANDLALTRLDELQSNQTSGVGGGDE